MNPWWAMRKNFVPSHPQRVRPILTRHHEVRAIRVKDLTTCTSCTHVTSCSRCPGLAYLEGNMRGPSTQDCEKSFARTGVPSANMLAKKQRAAANLVQIRALPTLASARV